MSPDATKVLKQLLYEQEGYRQYPYKDTTGNLTIGIGRNLDANGISKDEALYMLDNDVNYFLTKLAKLLPFFNNLDEARQVVLVNMAFNLGINGLMEFKNTLSAIEHGDYDMAAANLLLSKAAKQDPNRYKKLSQIMKTGEVNA